MRLPSEDRKASNFWRLARPLWFLSIILSKKEVARLAMLLAEAVEALGWSEGEIGGALFGRRGTEGIDCVAVSVGVGVRGAGKLSGAGGGFASSSVAFLLEVFENGRRYLSDNLEASADSVKTEKGDCANRRRGMVLLMALVSPQSSLLM
jgi:hypothetical protein